MALNQTPKTRTKTMCPVFRTPSQLSGIVLPTHESVMKYYMWWKHMLKPTNATQEPTVADISEKVALEIENIWYKASIPTVSHSRMLQQIRAYHDKYMKLLKPYKGHHKDDSYKLKLYNFNHSSRGRLFDIATCKYKCQSNECHCEQDRRVPREEREFLEDQRTVRLMYISTVDKPASSKLQQRYKRNANEVQRSKKYAKSASGDRAVAVETSSEDKSINGEDSSANFQNEINIEQESTVDQLDEVGNEVSAGIQVYSPRRHMPALARACHRHMVSDRAAAAIASAVLNDFGIIMPGDISKVIDKNKIRRERRKTRKHLQEHETITNLCGLFFDGRKDKTMVNIK